MLEDLLGALALLGAAQGPVLGHADAVAVSATGDRHGSFPGLGGGGGKEGPGERRCKQAFRELHLSHGAP